MEHTDILTYKSLKLNGHIPEYTAQRVTHPEYTTKHNEINKYFTSLVYKWQRPNKWLAQMALQIGSNEMQYLALPYLRLHIFILMNELHTSTLEGLTLKYIYSTLLNHIIECKAIVFQQ